MKTIAASRLFQYLREHPQAILVDLRSPQAYKKGHMRGAQNIPYEILGENISRFSIRQELSFTVSGEALPWPQPDGWESQAGILRLLWADMKISPD